ncbi:MAG: HypC/HybG/HupF family hydrogenase formation chaperone [candidate division KSB1 bacterium]|nr:HypC/HybG/HupF family hydrogenase formation chaperone [candidate division KSB1 bacterium]
MCLCVPAQIVEIKDNLAKVTISGVTREASLLLAEDVKVGDYILLHAGYAISKVNEKEAQEQLQFLMEYRLL